MIEMYRPRPTLTSVGQFPSYFLPQYYSNLFIHDFNFIMLRHTSRQVSTIHSCQTL